MARAARTGPPASAENAPAEKNSAPVRVSVRTPMESGVLAELCGCAWQGLEYISEIIKGLSVQDIT